VVPNHTFGPRDVPQTLENRKVYLLDGREGDARSMKEAVALLATRIRGGGLNAHPLGELR
jgi:hypothetical protein